jgi:homoserine O-succinyltransferase/O-acetyltransferase
MSILLHPDLPASRCLAAEGVSVAVPPSGYAEGKAPLRIALINLMPKKIETETQFARVLADAGTDIELTLVLPDSYRPTHVPADHLEAFYRRFGEIVNERFDGVIVTGAPIETIPFEEVDYWTELRAIFDWARERTRSTFAVCWGAQAALQHFYGVPKHPLPEKRFGVYEHRVLRPGSPLLRGLENGFRTPVSRHTEVRVEDLPGGAGLEVLAASEEAGLCLLADQDLRLVCMFNHLEYDAGTLGAEFERDRALGRSIEVPVGYFPGDDPTAAPIATWSEAARRLFGNWIAELERRRSRPVEPAARLRWLLGRAGLTLVGRSAAGISVLTNDHPDALVQILRVLDQLGIRVLKLRSVRPKAGEQTLEMRLEPVEEARLERLSRRLARAASVRELAYRADDGSAGMIAVNLDWQSRPRVSAAG